MGIYTSFWQNRLKRIIEDIKPTEPLESEMQVPELDQIGERSSTGYNGKLFTWVGSVETRTETAVFRNLEEAIESNNQFKNKVPGYLKLNVYANAVLKIRYLPITFELLIARYKDISRERKDMEKKWQLIKTFQDAWRSYESRQISFSEFYHQIDFGILVYPTVVTIFTQVMNGNSAGFEKLLLELYDESKDLKDRINNYTTGFESVYYSLPNHGKNIFQEERTIATLLTFRYPEKYTLFKDSFYSKLSKGLGIKPYPRGEKIFHYYSLIDDFVTNHLKNHPDVIEEKNSRLDETCYKDQNNLILAQDILFLTLDAKESQDDTKDETFSESEAPTKPNAMKNSLNTILYGPPGTGKTYNTINKSVAVANPQFDIANASREQLKAEYERLVKDGQIEFITFHQSMTYEDFIEGIKPIEPKEGDEFLKYEIKEGIFKRLCERASKVPETMPTGFSISEDEFQKAGFYKLSLGDTSNSDDDQIYEWCVQNGYVALGWGDAIDFTGKSESEIQQMAPTEIKPFAATAINSFIHHLKIGNIVIVSYGNLLFRAVGKVTGEYEYKTVEGLQVHQFRKVEWLLKDVELPYEEVYDRQFSQQSIYRMDKKGIRKDLFITSTQQTDVTFDELYQFFLQNLSNRLKEHSKDNPFYVDGRKSRIKILEILDERIITIGESANSEETIYKERLKQIYDKYTSPDEITNINKLRDINTAISWTSNYFAVFKALKDFEASFKINSGPKEKVTHDKNYVLIIDEINRGNVSQIFGELITLIEEDKRAGKEESLTVVLPYSKKSFSVPPNLYIIGTMNTADRSVEALDTALRRRFTFELMPPETFRIKEHPERIDLSKMLSAINERLEALLTKDHVIGHAWLMKINNLDQLRTAFKNKILPLLQEFFYNDYAKIGLVLGKRFVNTKSIGQKLFADFDDGNELASEYTDKVLYTLKNPIELELEDFKSIYE